MTTDVFHAASRRWFTQHALDGGQYAAPSLMLAKVVGAISRRTGQSELANRALQHLLHVPGLRLVSLDRRLRQAAAHLAGSAGLRGADTVYAALAQHLAIPLITWDQEIGRRLGAGLTVLTPPQAPAPIDCPVDRQEFAIVDAVRQSGDGGPPGCRETVATHNDLSDKVGEFVGDMSVVAQDSDRSRSAPPYFHATNGAS